MDTQNTTRGFTFVEIVIVIAVLFILAAISVVSFRNLLLSASYRVAVQEVYTQLTDARNDTLASENDTVYGVHFERGSTTYFIGDTFVEGTASNVVYEFEGGTYATSSFITNDVNVIFKRLSGLPTATGTILIIKSDGSATSTIEVHDSGLIEN